MGEGVGDMEWAVYTQSKYDIPGQCDEVKVFVIKAETPAGALAVLQEKEPGQQVRGMVQLVRSSWKSKLWE